jgi:hypothetical protein
MLDILFYEIITSQAASLIKPVTFRVHETKILFYQ